ncbi:c-type cytochrome biogenesis protein CcsB [Paenibacillus sp. NPDC056579]|uniref:c-type cytochrome biogenesis protein CcsB n=1 Tax=unclassified Paenibacillus TaxID=185978 RepID=UPI001EF97A0D|nr:c-type cytochrome biogenesis protein CcsB [Paenibacillus sp. H1-7]ULL15528.1 c-type cytochrome biogenesis protein CcsB [Paenibacillus sp. H1-7]
MDSSSFLFLAFIVYSVAFLIFVVAITGKQWNQQNPEEHVAKWGKVGIIASIIGFACHAAFFFLRWAEAGHIPTSNMFEFMTFLGMMIMLAFIIVYFIYRTPVLGVFALPVGIIIIAYASVFPKEIQPLIPALQSYWLKIHVTTAALGEAFFAVGFAAGLMYLLRTIDFGNKDRSSKKERVGVEITMGFLIVIVAFVVSIFSFNAAGYHASFAVTSTDDTGNTVQSTSKYVLPPIFAPDNSEVIEMKPFLGMTEPLLEAPSFFKGSDAGRKLNTVVWSILGGIVLYLLLRLAARKPLSAAISPLMKGMEEEDIDEISYRAIAIGYPIFTLGALIFAMIWAAEAWGRFWGWDPKEVWALITWLYYAAYLHLRLSRGWQGKKSAWLSVIGFMVVMFTLVGVNLVIAGLHSYAGV